MVAPPLLPSYKKPCLLGADQMTALKCHCLHLHALVRRSVDQSIGQSVSAAVDPRNQCRRGSSLSS